MQAIRAEIGTNRKKNSFIYKCTAGCRSTPNEYNNLHTKFYPFSQAGRSKDVLAVGSANMMLNAAIHQWNDLYFTSGDHELFRQFVALFNDMRKDYDTRQPAAVLLRPPAAVPACDDSVDKHTAVGLPRAVGPKNDLSSTMLDRIQCLTPDGAGGQSAPAWRCRCTPCAASAATTWPRRSARSGSEGCDVRVIYGLIGYHTKRVLGAPTHARPDPAALHRAGLQPRRQLRPQQRRRATT